MKNFISLLHTKIARVLLLLFLILFVWWLWIYSSMDNQKLLWSSTYQILALFGAAAGIIISRTYLRGINSALGRAILGFSVGLLFQSFGQTSYTYYNLFRHITNPYPSVADIGFFGSIPLYLYAIVQLAKASGIKVSLKSFGNKIQALLIPLGMLSLSYYIFLKDYVFDWSDPLKIVLDFGYPFGEAIYVSIAILTFILSRKILGGALRSPILFLVFALTFQYVTDFIFLYQASHNSWQIAGINDFMYAVSYLLMGLGIISVGEVSKKVREINVYGDRVVFNSSSNEFSVVVENHELADALRKGFMACFRRGRVRNNKGLNPVCVS